MISISVNQQPKTLPQQTSVESMLQLLEISHLGCAIAINGAVLPRSLWAEHSLSQHDEVDIFQIIAGG